MPKKETPDTPKKDLQADHVGTIRLPRGHWDAFVIYCLREGITHKVAMTKMVEQFVDKDTLDFAYAGTTSGGRSPHAKGHTKGS